VPRLDLAWLRRVRRLEICLQTPRQLRLVPHRDHSTSTLVSTPVTVQSTLGRHKHSRARRPSSVEDRDSSNEDGEAFGNDAGAEDGEEDTGELPHGRGKAHGKGKRLPNENTHANAIKRTRRESPPPLARRKPPKGGRYILAEEQRQGCDG